MWCIDQAPLFYERCRLLVGNLDYRCFNLTLNIRTLIVITLLAPKT